MTKETTKNVLIILIILLVIGVTTFLVDLNMIISGKKPMFSIESKSYDDGVTIEYMGLGYKIFDYKVLNGKEKIQFGTLFMTYSKD